MAATESRALSIINEFAYSNNAWKTTSSKRGSDSNWLILKTDTAAGSPDYIDIDRYYNFYGVMSPRVEVEFRVGKPEDGGLEWINICGEPYALLTNKETKVTEERKLAVARIKTGDKYHIGYVFYDSTDLKTDGTCDVPDSEISIGKTIGENREVTSIYQKNVNNNYFVSANIEDSGFRNLTLELYDRSFTTIQSLLFEAISNASSTAIAGREVSNSNSSYNLAFIKMPNLTNNNIRIRYGYNENTETTVPNIEYWNKMGVGSNTYYTDFYKPENKSRPYRWVSRKSQSGLVVGSDGNLSGYGDEYTTTSDVATDKVLYTFNNQSTVIGGYEEFYITNVQSNLTNTGIRYQISAVGNDALKLNGYKMVQKYAEIVAKPEEILAAFMKMFNYESDSKPTNSSTSMIKLVWTDEHDFVGIKKVVLNKKGEYEAQSTDDQRKEIEKNKELASFLNKRISILSSALGLLETQVVSDNEWVYAGNVTEAKKYYSDYNPENMFIKDKEPDLYKNSTTAEGKKNINKENQKGIYLYEVATKVIGDDNKLKDIKFMGVLNHYLKQYNYNFKTPDRKDKEYKDDSSAYSGEMFYNYRVGNAVTSYLSSLKYDYENIDFSKLNSHFKTKATQLEKIELIKELKELISGYIQRNAIKYESGKAKGVYVYLPNYIETILQTNTAKMMNWCVFKNGNSFNTSSGKVTGILPTETFAKAFCKDDSYTKALREPWRLFPFESASSDPHINKLFNDYIDKAPGVSYQTITYNKDALLLNAICGFSGYTNAETSFYKQLEKLERSETIADVNYNNKNLDGTSTATSMVAVLYALGCAGLYKSNGAVRDVSEIANYKKTYIKDDNTIKSEYFQYKIYNFDTAYFNGYRYVNPLKNCWDEKGVDVERPDGTKITWKDALLPTAEEMNKFNKDFFSILEDIQTIMKEELEAAQNDMDNWSSLSMKEQLIKVANSIGNDDTCDVNLNNVKEMVYTASSSGKTEYVNAYTGKTTISWDYYKGSEKAIDNIYNDIFLLKSTTLSGDIKDSELSNNNYVKYKEIAKEVSKEIESLNKKLKETTDLVSKQESNILNDEITVSLGGESASSSESKKYKSISSLLNEFCAACPPYVDYAAIIDSKKRALKGEEDKDKKKYIDENGNEQELSIKENLPSYALTWDIVGYYKDDLGVYMPVVGLHYKKPIKPKKLRVYKWGTGNPDAHAIKSLNISSSSEFAMLSSAANSTLTIDGYKKAAVKGIDEANEDATKASYENYSPGDSPSYFKNVVTNNDRHKIVDAMFNSINRGTITLLGDPSLRFGGYVNPYCFPIYLDIKLQNEGKATVPSVASNGMPSTLSGVYVISKITHSLTQQGYTTTLEVMRYPGINEVIGS